jgi:hypothetical protein
MVLRQNDPGINHRINCFSILEKLLSAYEWTEGRGRGKMRGGRRKEEEGGRRKNEGGRRKEEE